MARRNTAAKATATAIAQWRIHFEFIGQRAIDRPSVSLAVGVPPIWTRISGRTGRVQPNGKPFAYDAMPRFHFHVRDHDDVTPDLEGFELEDEAAAMDTARADALDIIDDAIATGDNITHQVIEVTDAEGKLIGTVALSYFLETAIRRRLDS